MIEERCEEERSCCRVYAGLTRWAKELQVHCVHEVKCEAIYLVMKRYQAKEGRGEGQKSFCVFFSMRLFPVRLCAPIHPASPGGKQEMENSPNPVKSQFFRMKCEEERRKEEEVRIIIMVDFFICWWPFVFFNQTGNCLVNYKINTTATNPYVPQPGGM